MQYSWYFTNVPCIYCVGAFSDEEVIHVEGDVDPTRDLTIIHDELRLKDLEYIAKNMDNLERAVNRGGDKKKKPEFVSFVTMVHQL